MIVERQLLILSYVLHSEYAHADLSQDIPFASDTVRVARMIDEASYVAIEGRIDYLIVSCLHQVGAGRVLVQFHSFFSQFCVNREYLTDILHDKLALSDRFASQKTPALVFGLERVDIGILMQLEPSVLAVSATGTGPGTTL